MSKFGYSFIYDNISSETYNLILCNIDNNSDTSKMILPEREIVKGEFNNYRYKPNQFTKSYTDVLTFTVTIMKNFDNKTQNELYFSRKEINEIVSWLDSPKINTKLYINDDEQNIEKIHYNGLFNNYESICANDRIIGLTCTFVNDSPYAYTEEKLFEFNSESADAYIERTVKNLSTEKYDYIYPIIEILPTKTGTITLKNVTDNNNFINIYGYKLATITMDCNKLKIYDDIGVCDYSDLKLNDVDNIYWFRLLYGNNTIQITGLCNIKFKFIELRKVGEY